MRHWMKAAGVSIALLTGSIAPAGAATLDEVIAGAKKEGAILWYDSLPAEQGNAILQAFQKEYPFITKIEYLEVPGSAKMARIAQESRAGGPTADVSINNAAAAQEHIGQGFVTEIDWKALQVPVSADLTPDKYMIAATTSTYVLVYNTNKVKESEVPKNYEEMIDPKWKKRIGTWSRAITFVTFDSVWGQEKTTEYVRSFAKLEPQLFRSTYTIAQAVGAGEIDLGYTIYHTALPTLEKGAPIKFVFLEPVPLSMLYATALKHGKNPNAAKLFLKWLGTTNGALAYEKQAQRGNYLVPETATAKMLKGKKLAFDTAQQEIEKAARYNKMEGDFNKILSGR